MNPRALWSRNFFVTIVFLLSIFLLSRPFQVEATWDGTPYTAGQTLNPECAPTDQNCAVAGTPWQTTATSTNTSLYVGIGTSSPLYNLDVNGDINFTGSLFQNGIAFGGNAGALSINNINSIWSSNTSEPLNNYVLAIGDHAGFEANNNSQKSNFIGYYAGNAATNAYNANFIGVNAGDGATYADKSNFIGHRAGNGAVNANYANFLGRYAGFGATDASHSNFIGNLAGYQASNANYSNFMGESAGYGATFASDSLFLGNYAGYNDSVNNNEGGTSIAIGRYSGTGGFSNSIAIGHGVVNDASNQFNIGNVLYGTGIYANDSRSSTPTGGSIGIGTQNPTSMFDVVSSQAGQVPVATFESDYQDIDQGPSIDFRDKNVSTNMILDPSARIQALAVAPGGAGLGFYYNQGLFGESHVLTEAMRISGINGYVGIGTTNPTHLLDLANANIDFDGSASFGNGALHITNTGDVTTSGVFQSTSGVFRGVDQYHQIVFSDQGNNTNYYEWGDTLASGGGHKFYTGGDSQSLRMQIANDGTYFSGNVGIGTTLPTHNLSFPADTPATIGVESSGSQGVAGDLTISAGTDTGGYNTGGSLILKAGNAFAGGDEHAGDIRLYAGANNYSEGSVLGNIVFYKGELNGLYTEAMRMNNEGKLGIGTALPTSALTINYDEMSYGNGGLTVKNINVSDSAAYISLGSPSLMSSISAGSGSDTFMISAGNTGGVALGSGDTSWHSASDARLKKNVLTLTGSSTLDKVLALDPVTFNWIDPKMSTTTQYGFIAQDVLKLFPELVSTPADPTKCVPGNAINNCYGVSYDRFGVLAIAAIKDIAGITGVFKNNLIAWFGDMSNGIQNLFVKEVHTNKICVAKSDGTEVCITGDELQKLVSTPVVTNLTTVPTGGNSSGDISSDTNSNISTTTSSSDGNSNIGDQQTIDNNSQVTTTTSGSTAGDSGISTGDQVN